MAAVTGPPLDREPGKKRRRPAHEWLRGLLNRVFRVSLGPRPGDSKTSGARSCSRCGGSGIEPEDR
jgi:hypothetical protein